MGCRPAAPLLALLVVTATTSAAAAADPPDLATIPSARPAPPAPGSQPPPMPAPMSPAEVPPGYAMPPYPYPYPAPPPIELPPSPPRARFSTPLMVSGIVLTGAGIASVIAGSVLVSQSAGRIDVYCDTPSFPCAHKDDATRETAGAIFMAAGGVMGAAGVALWIVGSKTILVQKPGAAAIPEVRVGPASASLTLRF